jgi:hypothetical protein
LPPLSAFRATAEAYANKVACNAVKNDYYKPRENWSVTMRLQGNNYCREQGAKLN